MDSLYYAATLCLPPFMSWGQRLCCQRQHSHSPRHTHTHSLLTWEFLSSRHKRIHPEDCQKKTTTETILAYVFLLRLTTTRRLRPVFSCCWLGVNSSSNNNNNNNNRPSSWGSDGLINIMLFCLFWTKISWCLSVRCLTNTLVSEKTHVFFFVFTQY